MITVLRSELSPFVSGSPIHDVRVRTTGGVHDIVVKDLAYESLIPEARAVKDADSYDPAREAGVYEHVLQDRELGTARWFGTLNDSAERPRWLFLERVDGMRLDHSPLTSWVASARWLARFHTSIGSDRWRDRVPLVRHDRESYMRWSHRAREHLPCPPRWLDRYDAVADHLSSLPTTLIHGDFTPANIIVAGRRMCPIDWERAAIGPPVLDLGSIIAGLRPEQAQSMIDAYAAITSQPIDRRSLTMAQLHLCVQWLGWAPGDWQPTHQHRDWLSDADHLAGEIGL